LPDLKPYPSLRLSSSRGSLDSPSIPNILTRWLHVPIQFLTKHHPGLICFVDSLRYQHGCLASPHSQRIGCIRVLIRRPIYIHTSSILQEAYPAILTSLDSVRRIVALAESIRALFLVTYEYRQTYRTNSLTISILFAAYWLIDT
jgi:hypothetical protein